MKITSKTSEFQSCPEYIGRAVCVDVTPLKKMQSSFGEREVFKVVFETTSERPDGSKFCVWSNFLAPSLHREGQPDKVHARMADAI
jgi:hypothetical protein